jgi:hypothetical protein
LECRPMLYLYQFKFCSHQSLDHQKTAKKLIVGQDESYQS